MGADEGFSSLFPDSPIPKAFLYANRFEVVYQHTCRHQAFSRSILKSADANNNHDQQQTVTTGSSSFRLRQIEYLLGHSTSRIDSLVVLGALSQLREADWYLEDPTGSVRIDFSSATFHEGLFPEGCIVIVEGWYEDKLLHATGIGLPPCEPASTSIRSFSHANPFGGGPSGSVAATLDAKMLQLMTTTQAGLDAMLVLLGETQLSQTGCLDRLGVLFAGYVACPPVGFVLTGNYLGSDYAGRSCRQRTNFGHLPTGSQPRLILVPGPDDLVGAPSNLLPKPSLVNLVFPKGQEQVPPWLHLTSNPCRLRIYARELVIFRADYTNLLLRHCVHLPGLVEASTSSDSSQTSITANSSSSIEQQARDSQSTPSRRLGSSLARCLASQAHLLPLPGHISPVYWAYDQALSLHPLPSLVALVEPESVVLGDLIETATNGQSAVVTPLGTNCQFTGLGRFGGQTSSANNSGRQFSFKVYYPSSEMIEDSCLPDDV